ncbi:glycosyltransferase family 4 protein [Flagellimonas iocasae]|uniref:Glycosyltransferase family 4 protein n=1 Tax=Flagellimonas iocasae TaxID=2055905 RepID=A0ABW4XYP0_9FLAO
MRICITRSEKYAYSETFVRDQIAGFSKLAEVFPIHSGRYPEREENDATLSPKPFWLMHKVVKTFLGRNNLFSDYGVKKYFKEHKIEVVLANYGMSASHMVPPCRALGIPLLVIFHGHDATDKKLLQKYHEKYQRLFGYASFIIVVSNEMKMGLIHLGAPPEKVRVVPCGVDTQKFTPNTNPSTTRHFIAVGRFTAKKGPLYTIRAFNQVLKKFPDAKLTMVGKKAGLYDSCQQLVNELNIQKSVIFTGVLEQDKISDLMKTSLAFVQHSITAPNGDMEGTPVSIMEACASGLPVVSTLHGGIKDAVIHGKTGFLVEETNENDMAKYMIELCENAELAKEMGLKGRTHIQQDYEQQNQIKKLYDLAKEAIA